MVEDKFSNLLGEEDGYNGKGSGFTLLSIDGVLLAIYEYTPLGGSSYIPLPASIKNKKAVINTQNNDQQCFKWAILSKYMREEDTKYVGENCKIYENKFNF